MVCDHNFVSDVLLSMPPAKLPKNRILALMEDYQRHWEDPKLEFWDAEVPPNCRRPLITMGMFYASMRCFVSIRENMPKQESEIPGWFLESLKICRHLGAWGTKGVQPILAFEHATHYLFEGLVIDRRPNLVADPAGQTIYAKIAEDLPEEVQGIPPEFLCHAKIAARANDRIVKAMHVLGVFDLGTKEQRPTTLAGQIRKVHLMLEKNNAGAEELKTQIDESLQEVPQEIGFQIE